MRLVGRKRAVLAVATRMCATARSVTSRAVGHPAPHGAESTTVLTPFLLISPSTPSARLPPHLRSQRPLASSRPRSGSTHPSRPIGPEILRARPKTTCAPQSPSSSAPSPDFFVGAGAIIAAEGNGYTSPLGIAIIDGLAIGVMVAALRACLRCPLLPRCDLWLPFDAPHQAGAGWRLLDLAARGRGGRGAAPHGAAPATNLTEAMRSAFLPLATVLLPAPVSCWRASLMFLLVTVVFGTVVDPEGRLQGDCCAGDWLDDHD